MKEQLVCSLELSKKLLTLGVKQNSLFSWFHTEKYGSVIEESNMSFDLDHYLSVGRESSAFLAEELGQMLPQRIIKEELIEIGGEKHAIKYDYHFKLSNYAASDHWHCSYIGYPIMEGLTLTQLGSSSFGEHDENLANAIAKMIIYLIENKLMELPK